MSALGLYKNNRWTPAKSFRTYACKFIKGEQQPTSTTTHMPTHYVNGQKLNGKRSNEYTVIYTYMQMYWMNV